MNLLIIGGLLVVGLLCLLGVVFLAMGEQRSVRAANSRASVVPLSPVSAPVSVPMPIEGQEREFPTARQTGEFGPNRATRLTKPLISAAMDAETTTTLRMRAEERQRAEKQQAMFNGQFVELASELRDLHQQAWEFEQRLRVLTDIVDRIEHPLSDAIEIEDEKTHLYSSTSRPLADSTQA